MTGSLAGVMGSPVGESRSPLIHTHWMGRYGVEGRYEAWETPSREVEDRWGALCREEGFVGMNVTVPHKRRVWEMFRAGAGRLDETAGRLGAMNLVMREEDGWVGRNADVEGFVRGLDEAFSDLQGASWEGEWVVLGSGGASRAALAGLAMKGTAARVVCRDVGRGEAAARDAGGVVRVYGWEKLYEACAGATGLVNATTLGMGGMGGGKKDGDEWGAGLSGMCEGMCAGLCDGATVMDMVYVPLETGLLKTARERGLKAVDGLGMLLWQAAASFRCWFGVEPDIREARELAAKSLGFGLSGGAR